MRIAFYGDSLTEGTPGVSFISILETRLPEHKLINQGKGGDTVKSLYRRLVRMQPRESVDIAFLWVGVNDVFPKVSLTHAILKRLLRQPRARTHKEFRDNYDRLLRLLLGQARTVLTVSPLLVGEDPMNPWNQELAALSEIVASISRSFDRVQYVDLRTVLLSKLAERTISGYVARSLSTIARDALLLRSPGRIDNAASHRGLHLTLDGVHLNSAGAEIVARVFRERIGAVS